MSNLVADPASRSSDLHHRQPCPMSLHRLGVLMSPDLDNPDEIEGVLNPG